MPSPWPSRSVTSAACVGLCASVSVSTSVAGVDTLYVADDNIDGLRKYSLVGGSWVTNGSINFDDRSFRINGEGNINVYDPEFAARQVRIFEKDKSQSVRIDPKAFKKRPLRIKFVEHFWGLFRGLL